MYCGCWMSINGSRERLETETRHSVIFIGDDASVIMDILKMRTRQHRHEGGARH